MPFTYTFTSNPGNLFNISGSNIIVNNSSIEAGSYPVTVRADDGFGTVIFQNLRLIATGGTVPPSLNFSLAQNSQYITTIIGSV